MKLMKYYIWMVCLWFCCTQVSAQEQEQSEPQQSRELSNDEIKEMYHRIVHRQTDGNRK